MVDKNIPLRVNEELIAGIDKLIKAGIFRNRNEGIREGIRRLSLQYDAQKKTTFMKSQMAMIIANYLRLNNSEDFVAIILFGSVAKGTDHEESDIDILVLTRIKYTYAQKSQIMNQIVHLTHNVDYTISIHYETTQKYLERIQQKFSFESNIAKEGKVLSGVLPTISI